jgi:proline iminopeptidase
MRVNLMKPYTKEIIKHSHLYITRFHKSKKLPWVVFVHGGPGLNSGTLEALIESYAIFSSLNFNIILYDQRGCGRSENPGGHPVKHCDNVSDLEKLISFLIKEANISPKIIIGHSYGAKLLYDYLAKTNNNLFGVFISTATSILTPRINNLLLDLAYLKSKDRDRYQELLEQFENFNDDDIWNITEKLSDIFHENENRSNIYWANMDWKDKVTCIQKNINLPMSRAVFTSVREDLYLSKKNYLINFQLLNSDNYLRINGLHDLIMNGQASLNDKSLGTKIFFKSSHYPHIEENTRFCREINAIIN